MNPIICKKIKLVPLLVNRTGLALEQCAIITLFNGKEMAVFDPNLQLNQSLNNRFGKAIISVLFPTIKRQKDKIKKILPYPDVSLCYSKNKFTIPFNKNKFFGLITKIKLDKQKKLDEFFLDVGENGSLIIDTSGSKINSSAYRVGDYVEVINGRTDIVDFVVTKKKMQ